MPWPRLLLGGLCGKKKKVKAPKQKSDTATNEDLNTSIYTYYTEATERTDPADAANAIDNSMLLEGMANAEMNP